VASGFAFVLLAKTLRSTTFKLALISIVVFGAVVIGLFGYVYSSTTNFVMTRSDSAIEAERAMLRNAYDGGGRDSLIQVIEERAARGEGGIYLLANESFAPIAGNLKKWPSTLKAAKEWIEFNSDPLNPKATTDQALFLAKWETLPDGLHLLVGRDISDLGRFASKIHAAFAFAILFIFVLAAVASVSVTRRTVGRIESINATSRAIMESGLGRRIPLRGAGDEWDDLAENLNSMLERIEALMSDVKQVSDNVAHDLRTPLTRMRGRLEKATIENSGPDHEQSLIGQMMADLDEVLRMFSSLTRISQVETMNQTSAFRTVNLVEIATEVAELFDAAAENKGGQVEVVNDKPVLVNADRDLLFDAMANLVDNAVKHGREGGLVTVCIDLNDSEVIVSVADDGPGIPADEFEHVFKRFYRLERSRSTPGNGLGLSLVAAVTRLHGGRIALSDNTPGLKVELHFPSIHGAGEATHGKPIVASNQQKL
jgi:signal transduction histidine kinase